MKQSTRLAVWDRDNGQCQYVDSRGIKCGKPAQEVHHKKPKGMGGRQGKARKESEDIDNYECRCWLHNHAVEIDGKYYMGHTG